MSRVALVLGLALLALPAAAQQTPKPEPGKADPDIVINGKFDEQIDTLIRRFTPARDHRQIARWEDNNRLCTRVVGLWPERADYLSQRIAAVAKSIGLAVAEKPTCVANNIIIFTSEADRFTAAAIERHPQLIRNVDDLGLPHGKLKESYLAPRAVRWFSIRQTGNADGAPSGATGGMPSRIRMMTRENTIVSVIVVDEPKLVGIKWGQLGDYLAMVSLGQPQLDADYAGDDSIMAIFAARDAGNPRTAGLTAQDRGFLAALYRSDASLDPDRQREQIGDDLKKDKAGK